MFRSWTARINNRGDKRAASIPRSRPRKARPRLLGLVLVASCVLTGAKASRAGRPLVVDDAAPVAVGHVEVEIGLSHTRAHGGGRQQAVPMLTTAYGIIDKLEIGLGIQRVNHDQREEARVRGFENLHLLTKFMVIEEAEVLPAAAFSLDVSVPTANAAKGLSIGKSEQAFTFIMSKLHDLTGLHLSLGYLLVDSPRGAKLKNRLRGGIAAEYGIHPGTAVVGEVFGSSRASKGEQNEAAFQLGLRYALSPGLLLDVAAGRSLRSSGASLHGTAGITWTIDIANHEKAGADSRRGARPPQISYRDRID
jgi:hypothetical protein